MSMTGRTLAILLIFEVSALALFVGGGIILIVIHYLK